MAVTEDDSSSASAADKRKTVGDEGELNLLQAVNLILDGFPFAISNQIL